MPTLTVSLFRRPSQSSTGSDSTSAICSKNSTHFDKLDHLRFLAAFLILLHHGVPAILCAINGVACSWIELIRLTGNLEGVDLFAKALVLEGHTAVALFITLSGFLFARICDKDEIHYGKFVLNRVLRIYPLYTCAVILAMYLNPSNGLINLLTSLLCFQNLPSSVTDGFITPPFWTVAVEFQFYLLFPFFLRLFIKQGSKPILLLLTLSLVLKVLIWIHVGSIRDLSYQTLFGRIDQFIVGMLAGWYYRLYEKRLRNPFCLLSASIAVTTMLAVFHRCGGFQHTAKSAIWMIWPLVEGLGWVAVIATYSASTFTLPKQMSRVLCSLGTISFSMYLSHYAFAHLLANKAGPLIRRALDRSDNWLHPLASTLFQQQIYGSMVFVVVIVLPVTIAFSFLTYRTIEKPFMDMRVRYKFFPNAAD